MAILLGPAGVGISGLYTSATTLVQQLTSFGLSSSAVRNVSEANATGDQNRINRVVTALKRLVWITGLLGVIAVVVFSPLLSKTSFGDTRHIIPFIVISVTLLLNQLSAGQKVILQGTRKLKYLAKSSAYGITIGLFVSLPLYYFFGVNGIVPNIVLSSLIAFLLTWYFSQKVEVEKVQMNNKEVLSEGKTMLTMGIAMSITTILASASSYALRGYIRLLDSVESVGLFTLGFTLMNQYTGLIFNAMSTDFYPRLSAVNNDNIQCKEIVNKQNEIGVLIIAPMLSLCIVFISLVIKILASEKFLPITGYMVWAAWGILFKVASWSIGYIFLAKAESKLFMITEIVTCVYTFVLSIVGYKFLGLTGVGLATAISLILYLIMVYIIANKRYQFTYDRSFVRLFLIHFILITACVACVYILPTLWKYIIGTILASIGCYFSFVELHKRIDIYSILQKKRRP